MTIGITKTREACALLLAALKLVKQEIAIPDCAPEVKTELRIIFDDDSELDELLYELMHQAREPVVASTVNQEPAAGAVADATGEPGEADPTDAAGGGTTEVIKDEEPEPSTGKATGPAPVEEQTVGEA